MSIGASGSGFHIDTPHSHRPDLVGQALYRVLAFILRVHPWVGGTMVGQHMWGLVVEDKRRGGAPGGSVG